MSLRRFSLVTGLVILGLISLGLTRESIAQTLFANPINNSHFNSVGTGKLLEELELSEEQREQIRAIQAKYSDNLAQSYQDLDDAYQQLRDMMINNTPEEVIRQKYSEIMEMRQETANLRFESMLEVRNVLTREQRQELAELMEQRRVDYGRNFRRPTSLIP